MQIRRALTRNRWLPGALGLALLLATGVSVARTSSAAATAPCLPHANSSDELEWLRLHKDWRNEYIPGTNPSDPLVVSSTLNAAAAGYATYMADHPGAVGHAADGAEWAPWATRAKLCGYPASVAVGGEAMSLVTNASGPVAPQQALENMTSEVWGGAIRIPAFVDGYPMKCIGVAHAMSADGKRDVWITIIMSADGSCPQTVAVPTATPTEEGAFPFPSRTATPTKTATPTRTATPKATATKTATPKPAVYKLQMQAIASDGGE